MQRTLTRREFLQLALAGLVVGGGGLAACGTSGGGTASGPAVSATIPPTVAATPTVATTPTPMGPQAQLIADVVREKLDYLTVSDEAMARFASDYLEKRGMSDEAQAALREGNERSVTFLVTLFLMSSDFFWNDADTERVVGYRSYYNPNIACSNPFAELI